MRIEFIRVAFLSALLLGLHSGCGGSSNAPTLGTVTGTVTMDGEPVKGARVTFWPKSGGRTSRGTTDEDGAYELRYSPKAMGAKVGICIVSVSTMTEAQYDETGEDVIQAPRAEEIPAKYNDESAYEKEVKPGSNEIDLELTSE